MVLISYLETRMLNMDNGPERERLFNFLNRYFSSKYYFKVGLISALRKESIGTLKWHIGGYIACLGATWNLFSLRQNILKHSLHICKSKSKFVLYPTIGFIGTMYYLGLIGVWHIPSFSAEVTSKIF